MQFTNEFFFTFISFSGIFFFQTMIIIINIEELMKVLGYFTNMKLEQLKNKYYFLR